MSLVTRLVRAATLGAAGVSGVLLSAVMLMLVANVVLRLLGMPILGMYEIMASASVMMLGLSLADAQRQKQNVAIDLVTARLPKRVQNAIAVFTTLLSGIVFAVIAIALMRYAGFQIDTGTTSELLRLPTWPALVALTVGIILVLCVLLVDLARQSESLITGVQKKEIW